MGIMDFSMARLKHATWRMRLRNFLDGREGLTREQATSHKECDLGKWLYSEGLSKYGSVPDLLKLEKIHIELHATVKRIVEMKLAGNAVQAETEYRKVDAISQQIISLLEAVEKKVAAVV